MSNTYFIAFYFPLAANVHIDTRPNQWTILSTKWNSLTNCNKKSLKIPKGQSESVYRRTDNTMAKRKSTKGQTTINKTYI